MFGQHNDKQQDNAQIPDHSIDGAMNASHGQTAGAPGFGHPGTPLYDDQQPQTNGADATPSEQIVTPDATHPASPNPASSHHEHTNNDDSSASSQASVPHDLVEIKQKALSELSPLVGHLDQSPEEKFRTTMMMIQASDDQSLVQTAYEAAQNIKDEKTRAQALLDVVNEINYFTQQHHQ